MRRGFLGIDQAVGLSFALTQSITHGHLFDGLDEAAADRLDALVFESRAAA